MFINFEKLRIYMSAKKFIFSSSRDCDWTHKFNDSYSIDSSRDIVASYVFWKYQILWARCKNDESVAFFRLQNVNSRKKFSITQQSEALNERNNRKWIRKCCIFATTKRGVKKWSSLKILSLIMIICNASFFENDKSFVTKKRI